MAFKNNLRRLMTEHEVTQEELARAVNIKQQSISKFVTGQITASDPVKILIADYFGVTVDELIRDRDN